MKMEFNTGGIWGASPHTGSWVPGPGSETQDAGPGTQDHVCYEYLFEKSRGIAGSSFFSLERIFILRLPILW